MLQIISVRTGKKETGTTGLYLLISINISVISTNKLTNNFCIAAFPRSSPKTLCCGVAVDSPITKESMTISWLYYTEKDYFATDSSNYKVLQVRESRDAHILCHVSRDAHIWCYVSHDAHIWCHVSRDAHI
eukprot:sb/3475097/